MGKFKDNILDLVEDGYSRGMDGAKMARRLIEEGIAMMAAEDEIGVGQMLYVTDADGGRFAISQPTRPTPVETATFHATEALKLVAAEAGFPIVSFFVEKTEDGGVRIGWPNHDGRIAIVPANPVSHDFGDSQIERLQIERLQDAVRDAGKMFDGYAKLHLAKSPPDTDKATRNIEMATQMFTAVGDYYSPPEVPDFETTVIDRIERCLAAPLDRKELLAWFKLKLDGCTKSGMGEAYNVLRAFRDEVAQHLEAAPIDYAVALRSFYAHVYDRNVKAGWWSDLATGAPKKRNVGEMFILFVTELVEAYDAYRSKDNDDKLPHLPGLAVELGDLQIRLAEFCGALQAGKIVEHSDAINVGEQMFDRISVIAREYEDVRRTPEAKGEDEIGIEIGVQDVAGSIIEKLEYNKTRKDHQVENRMKEGGKQT